LSEEKKLNRRDAEVTKKYEDKEMFVVGTCVAAVHYAARESSPFASSL